MAAKVDWPALSAMGYKVEKSYAINVRRAQWFAFSPGYGSLGHCDTKGQAMARCREHADEAAR